MLTVGRQAVRKAFRLMSNIYGPVLDHFRNDFHRFEDFRLCRDDDVATFRCRFQQHGSCYHVSLGHEQATLGRLREFVVIARRQRPHLDDGIFAGFARSAFLGMIPLSVFGLRG
jgi:hypothetical protein